MAAKVLLLNVNTLSPPVAPVGLEYVGEHLRKNGINVEIGDLNFSGDIKKTLRENRPDFIGISIRNTDDCSFPSSSFFLPRIRDIYREIKSYTDTPVVFGGAGFSVMPLEVMEYLDADYGICGDGEGAMLKFINSFPDPENVENLIYRKNGGYIINPRKYFPVENFSPRRNLFDNPAYFRMGGMGSVETKRGCMGKCIYCADPLCRGEKIRLRSPSSAAEEFEALMEKGVDCFHLLDSEFNIPYGHAIDVCRELIKKGLNRKISWYAYCSPERFDSYLAGMMKEAGCKGINFGSDSASDSVLENLGRLHRAEDLKNTGKACREAELVFMFDMLIGGPGENRKTVKDTIERVKEIKPDVAGIALGLRIYPGTPLHGIVKKEGFKENRNIKGDVGKSRGFLKPVFYISSELRGDIFSFFQEITAGDERFMFSFGQSKNYNYNENRVLSEEIDKGARGAFWDILRRSRK